MKSAKFVMAALRKCKSCLPVPGKTTGRPRVIVHIPHSSTNIPEIFRQEFLPEKEKMHSELLCMTDWYTDELFDCPDCLTVVHRYSRLVCDPERFLDPEEESMWNCGMGMYYTRTSEGGRMKPSPLSSMESWKAYARALEIYQAHHSRLAKAVRKQVERYGKALLIDGHSFSASVLPYEPGENLLRERPEICLGTDAFFTPDTLLAAAKEYFSRNGLRVAVNTPFAGALVPEPFYSRRDKRVRSLMVEVNRRLYMDEATGEKNGGFDGMKKLIQGFLKKIGEY